jgi:hypothetical protein
MSESLGFWNILHVYMLVHVGTLWFDVDVSRVRVWVKIVFQNGLYVCKKKPHMSTCNVCRQQKQIKDTDVYLIVSLLRKVVHNFGS